MTKQEFFDKVDWEGGVGECGAFGWFGRDISEYASDHHLKYLWKEAYDAVTALVTYIEDWHELDEENA